jgi:hypothetical protein
MIFMSGATPAKFYLMLALVNKIVLCIGHVGYQTLAVGNHVSYVLEAGKMSKKDLIVGSGNLGANFYIHETVLEIS